MLSEFFYKTIDNKFNGMEFAEECASVRKVTGKRSNLVSVTFKNVNIIPIN